MAFIGFRINGDCGLVMAYINQEMVNIVPGERRLGLWSDQPDDEKRMEFHTSLENASAERSPLAALISY